MLRQSKSPDLQRPESSGAAAGRPQGQGSRARGSSPAQQRQGSLPAPVVAADFARKGSSGLAAYPSGDLAGRSERVRRVAHLLCIMTVCCTVTLCLHTIFCCEISACVCVSVHHVVGLGQMPAIKLQVNRIINS